MIRGIQFQVALCTDPQCRSVHFVISGDHMRSHIPEDTILADVAFPVENIPRLIEELRDAAYSIVTEAKTKEQDKT